MSKKRYEITAIIYDKKGKVISIGKNSYVKTHPLQIEHATKVGMPHKCFLHAEIHAIARCKDITKAHKIRVMRFDSLGNPRNAKPCPICQSAIEASGIIEVEHT